MSINVATAVEKHYQDIEKIDEAIRAAENFGDRKTWLEIDGSRKLLHVTELNAMRDKATAAIKDIMAGRNQ